LHTSPCRFAVSAVASVLNMVNEGSRDLNLPTVSYAAGRGRGRPFFLFRLRARADFNLAFCPGGIKKACFFASLIIFLVYTFRLKRLRELSIDSPGLTFTTAIKISNQLLCYSTNI